MELMKVSLSERVTPSEQVKRRLAAIFIGDVVGYSKLMGADEPGTLARLKTLRKELVDPKIAQYRGRVVNRAGDSILVEFKSVIDAVQCAVDIQRAMVERNAGVEAARRIEYRIGINLGDVIADGGAIFGDGVNIAARLQATARPGGLCISSQVHEDIAGKAEFDFEDLGELAFKNIARPVHAYQVRVEAPQKPPVEQAESGHDTLALPDKPSIAVLPMVNMSGDPEQEYFADGITEDIITALSRIRWLFVIARNSTFVYKGHAVDVKQVARDLGVRYVLEGSVRKIGSRVRITAQLIEVATGAHQWAALQDEITQRVAAAIEPRLLAAEGIRAQSRSPQDLDAWDLVMRANSLFWRLTKPDSEAAIAMLAEAVKRHPDYAPAHSMLAFGLLVSAYIGWIPIEPQLRTIADLAARATELDDSDPWAHLALGFHATMVRRTDEATYEFQRALDLNPNFAAAHGYLGFALMFDGRTDEAISHLEQAVRMSPQDSQNAIFNVGLSAAHYLADRYVEATDYARKAIQQRSAYAGAYRILCASLAQGGNLEEAGTVLARLKQLQPDASLASIRKHVPYQPGPMACFIEGLQKAGLE
ncbi:MAG: tetratricopeptide repeat protein [Burkholderiales bacterium]|nr:tetratricopeptide repeat protein [Burkholderiales bacterium]